MVEARGRRNGLGRHRVDQEFDQLIIGVGAVTLEPEGPITEGGDNLFLSSIVALDAKSGAYKWHYQTTPGDTWTGTWPCPARHLTIGGQRRKVAMQAPKNGFFKSRIAPRDN